MDMRQKQAMDAYERVLDFMNAHPLPDSAAYGAPKDLLEAAITRLVNHSRNQESGNRRERAETLRQRVLKQQLRDVHLRSIAEIARSVLKDVPGIGATLRFPDADIPIRHLLTKALSIRELAMTHEPVLVTNGCPVDFLQQLDAAIAVLNQSILKRSRSRGTRVGAREGLEHEIRRGRNAVRMLDAIVHRYFSGDPDTMAEWRAVKRVQAVPGGSNGAPDTTTGEPAPLGIVA